MYQFLFFRLILAHLIADFPLQTTKLIKLKTKKFTGVIIHSLIYLIVTILCCYPVLKNFWFFIILIVISHILIDQARISICRYLRRDDLWMFLGEQLLHIGSITFILWISNVKSLMPPAGVSLPKTISLSFDSFSRLLLYTYYDNKTIVYYIGFLISIFATSLLIYYMEKLILPKEEQLILGDYRELLGYFERGLITSLTLKGWYFWILIYVAARIVLNIIHRTIIDKNVSWKLLMWDAILNISLSIMYGNLILKWLSIL